MDMFISNSIHAVAAVKSELEHKTTIGMNMATQPLLKSAENSG